jgi:hypothetical protein
MLQLNNKIYNLPVLDNNRLYQIRLLKLNNSKNNNKLLSNKKNNRRFQKI